MNQHFLSVGGWTSSFVETPLMQIGMVVSAVLVVVVVATWSYAFLQMRSRCIKAISDVRSVSKSLDKGHEIDGSGSGFAKEWMLQTQYGWDHRDRTFAASLSRGVEQVYRLAQLDRQYRDSVYMVSTILSLLGALGLLLLFFVQQQAGTQPEGLLLSIVLLAMVSLFGLGLAGLQNAVIRRYANHLDEELKACATNREPLSFLKRLYSEIEREKDRIEKLEGKIEHETNKIEDVDRAVDSLWSREFNRPRKRVQG